MPENMVHQADLNIQFNKHKIQQCRFTVTAAKATGRQITNVSIRFNQKSTGTVHTLVLVETHQTPLQRAVKSVLHQLFEYQAGSNPPTDGKKILQKELKSALNGLPKEP